MMLLLSEKYGFHIQIHYLLAFHPVSDFQLYYYFGSTCNAGDPGLIPGSGRSPEERNSNPLQYSCLENSMDRGAWQFIVHGVTMSQT